MLAAAAADLSALPGTEVTTTLDGRFCQAGPKHADWAAEIHRVANVIDVSDPGEEIAWFHRLASQCDATLVIAPEFDGILFDRCRWVEQTGSRLLGSSSEAVALASDKDRTNRLLAEHGVPVAAGVPLKLPSTETLEAGIGTLPLDAVAYPAVLKPRFGAGSQCTYLIRHVSEAPGILEQALQEGIGEQALLETYVPGQPASVAVLIGENHVVPLPVCRQILSDDGRFRYLGGSVPFENPLALQAQEMAVRAAGLVPGLRGYVGVDLILDEHAPGASVVEINPRLTTSYVGLRAALGQNLMAALFQPDLSGFSISEQVGRVGFTPSGKVSRE